MFIKFKNNDKRKLPSGTKLKFGDLVFIDDRSFWNKMANMIRYVQTGGETNINYYCPNHCVMVLEEHPDINKVKVMQANYGGVSIKELSCWINHPKVNIIIERYKGKLRYEKSMELWMKEQEGKKYDYPAVVAIYARYLILRYSKSRFIRWYLKHKRNPLSSEKRFICSEFILRAYLKARIHLIRGKHFTNGTPYDIYKSKKIKPILKIYNHEYKKEKK